jgi:hypothetical protein
MGDMKKRRVKTEREIDEAVIASADDNSAWEKRVRVSRAKSESVSLPADMAARAAFFARLHREANVEQWIKKLSPNGLILKKRLSPHQNENLQPD